MVTENDAGAAAVAALLALSDLTPAAARQAGGDAVPLEWFRWLDDGLELFRPASPGDPLDRPSVGESFAREFLARQPQATSYPTLGVERAFGEGLAALQQVRGEQAVRVGWLWVAGTATITNPDGSARRSRVFRPLVTRRVRVLRRSPIAGWTLQSFGDFEITDLVTDRDMVRSFEEVEFGGGAFHRPSQLTPALLGRLSRLQNYAIHLSSAAGLPARVLTTAAEQPQTLMRRDGLQIVIGVGVFADGERAVTTRAGSLQAWTDVVNDDATAFHAVYADTAPDHPLDAGDDAAVESPLPLSPRQRDVVRRVRRQAVTVVSGAPGTGKSHTVAAVVADALRRGRSVLVTAKSDAAVDAVIALLERQPGLEPVVFGASERREALSQRLASLNPAPDATVERARRQLDEAVARRDRAWAAARRAVLPEELFTPGGAAALAQARLHAPAAFTGEADPETVAALATAANGGGGGWLARRRRRKAERTLRRLLHAPGSASLGEVVAAAEVAAVRTPLDHDPTPAACCRAAEAAEAAVRTALSEWLGLTSRSQERLDRGGLSAVAALSTALRSGRAARRAQLQRMRANRLTTALPLWVGTLSDVDDLLPPSPALFDLVVVDEASAVEQTSAAPALLRGRATLVVGDPNQLRHVSFLSDAAIEAVLQSRRIEDARRSQLDVRRNSLFDAATAVAPSIVLDEHFRSAPHLIDLVAERLYGGRVTVATRTPLTQEEDCVHLHSVDGTRGGDGVISAEVTAVLAEVRQLHRRGANSVGVISPFRAQADALEAAMLAAFSATELMAMDLRVGTVHAFQGNERDVIVCSLGLAAGDAGGWNFLSNPNLLAVLLTRARRRMIMVSSFTPAPHSLLGEYLARADAPPGAPAPAVAPTEWCDTIADGLASVGLPTYRCYPTGNHVVDVATISQGRPAAVVCGLHPAGVDAHLERHAALVRAGWQVHDALQSRWGDRPAELILDLSHRVTTGTLAP